MNRSEANSLLNAELNAYGQLRHVELVGLIGDEATIVRRGRDGTDYTISIWVRWNEAEGGDITVCGSVASADWGTPHDRLDDSVVISNGETK